MAKFDVIVDASATLTIENVEAQTQAEANDRVAKLVHTGWFCEHHRNDWVLCDPVVYRDNEDNEEEEE